MNVNKFLLMLMMVFMLSSQPPSYGYVMLSKSALRCTACVLAGWLFLSCGRCGKSVKKKIKGLNLKIV